MSLVSDSILIFIRRDFAKGEKNKFCEVEDRKSNEKRRRQKEEEDINKIVWKNVADQIVLELNWS